MLRTNDIGRLLAAAVLTLAGIAGAAAEISPPLRAHLAGAPSEEFVPITISLDGGVAPEVLAQMTAGLSREAARSLVKSVARERNAAAQREVMAFLEGAAAQGQVRDIRPLWAVNVIAAAAQPSVISRLAGFPNVRRMNYDVEREVITALAWGVEKIEADRVWNELGVDGTGVVVAVTDTGVDYEHTDLENRDWVNTGEIPNNNIDDDNNGFIDDYHGWNTYDSSPNTRGGDNGHGTHCSGTVVGDGTAGTQTGVAPGALVMPVQVLSNGGSGSESTVWAGMQYAFDNGADVTSMSLGWRHVWNPDRAAWRTLCENLIAGGMVYAIAAGNERQYTPGAPDNIRTPGDVPGVITVGATTQDDSYAYFSSYGPVSWENIPPWNDYPYPPGLTKPDVAAPGYQITSTKGISGGYSVKSGTSMATPHVAGFAALILEVAPNLTNAEVRQWMEDYALDLGPPGKDNDYGSGRIRAYDTIQAMQLTPITLKSFTARAAADGIRLRWVTSSEHMLAGFNLYRRPVAETPVAGVPKAGAATADGYTKLNHTLIKGKSPYIFDDEEVVAGTTYEYLLEDVDLLGRGRSHGPVEVRMGGGLKPTSFWLAQSAPNPARSRAVIKFGLAEGFGGRAVLTIYDITGRRVMTPLDRELNAGTYEVEVNTAALAPGVYIYRLAAQDYNAAKRLVVAR